jgi:hypothetical protein
MPVKIIAAINRDRMLRPGWLCAMRSPFCERPDADPGIVRGQWATDKLSLQLSDAFAANSPPGLFIYAAMAG